MKRGYGFAGAIGRSGKVVLYDFASLKCKRCGESSTIVVSRRRRNVQCPHCGETHTNREITRKDKPYGD